MAQATILGRYAFPSALLDGPVRTVTSAGRAFVAFRVELRPQAQTLGLHGHTGKGRAAGAIVRKRAYHLACPATHTPIRDKKHQPSPFFGSGSILARSKPLYTPRSFPPKAPRGREDVVLPPIRRGTASSCASPQAATTPFSHPASFLLAIPRPPAKVARAIRCFTVK